MDIVAEKAEEPALNIIQLCGKLSVEKNEWVISKQLLRSATSIGANISEAS
ncbi:MAG: four helix bundle protein [Bacteroidales bacterium]|nr:four helix bundle protein [Bacteroidales bacterium]